jgi:hypothetical protein
VSSFEGTSRGEFLLKHCEKQSVRAAATAPVDVVYTIELVTSLKSKTLTRHSSGLPPAVHWLYVSVIVSVAADPMNVVSDVVDTIV